LGDIAKPVVDFLACKHAKSYREQDRQVLQFRGEIGRRNWTDGWAWLQVEVDFREGLQDEIELVWQGFTWIQRIDYWKVPFRCYGCHEVGHLQAQCKHHPSQFPPFRKVWKQKTGVESSQEGGAHVGAEGSSSESVDRVKLSTQRSSSDKWSRFFF
jgi:hypothetical protein